MIPKEEILTKRIEVKMIGKKYLLAIEPYGDKTYIIKRNRHLGRFKKDMDFYAYFKKVSKFLWIDVLVPLSDKEVLG